MATDREKLPMVVLVNGLTGSVAEAVAGALQDTERAKIFGTTTVGKGSASEFIELSDGSAIYIPVSHWYTPSGRLIQNTGIKPDVEIPLTAEDRLIDVDAQLGEAYEYLDSLLPAFR
jgi:carboxyl-terminal processing protease